MLVFRVCIGFLYGASSVEDTTFGCTVPEYIGFPIEPDFKDPSRGF